MLTLRKQVLPLALSIFAIFGMAFLYSLISPSPAYAAACQYTTNTGASTTVIGESQYSKTKGMCVGESNDISGAFGNVYQFTVSVPKGLESAFVTAKTKSGQSITFLRESDTLFVSGPTAGYKNAGFVSNVMPVGIGQCNKDDPKNIITITAGNRNLSNVGNTQEFTENMCDFPKKFTITNSANELKKFDGSSTSDVGSIQGTIHINRTSDAIPAGHKALDGPIYKDCVNSISLTGGPSAKGTGDNRADWYDISNSTLKINNLKASKPGSLYNLTLDYNDKCGIAKQDGMPEWTEGSIKLSYPDLKVAAGKITYLGGEDKTLYYSPDGKKTTAPTGIDKEEAVERVSNCNIDGGLGWIVCPVVRFLAGVTDAAYGYVTAMLSVPSSILFDTSNSTGPSLYGPWSIMRNIANVAFVIAFLIIIYSQITSMGVSNYGIKKMLPRLIIAALLVNTSFWIAGIAVDLSNVLGESVYSVFGGYQIYNDAPGASEIPNWTTLGDIAVIGIGAAGTGAAVVSGLLSVSIFLPIILSAVLAILITVFILTLRQALIIGLIIISPLAFVAYLLPNTEDWFKRWWKLFRTLLLLFPVIALIFGVSNLASQVLFAVSNSPAYDANPMLKFVMQVMAAGVQILPLFLTTILTNVTSGVLGKVTGTVNNKNKGLIDRSRNMAKERQAYRWTQSKAGNGRLGKFRRGFKGFNPARAIGSGGRYLDDRKRTRKTNTEAAENDMEGSWRQTSSVAGGVFGGGGAQAVQNLDRSKDKLEKVKVAAEIDTIKNNQTVKADLAVEKIKLEGANAELKSSISQEIAENSSARGKAASSAMLNKYMAETADGNSGRMSQQAIAEQLYTSESMQRSAAGADKNYGPSRAKAAAKQTLDKLHEERVAAEKSRLSSTTNEELLTFHNDPTKSVEEKSAAVGLISSRSHRASQNQMWQSLYDDMHEADTRFRTATDPAEKAKAQADVDAISTLQQQASMDMKEKPFGLGDRAAGQVQIGAWGREFTDDAGKKQILPSFIDDFKKRLGEKTSGAGIPNMNPDDVKLALKLVQTGNLGSDPEAVKAGLGNAIMAAYSNKQYNDAIKGQQRADFDKILEIITKP